MMRTVNREGAGRPLEGLLQELRENTGRLERLLVDWGEVEVMTVARMRLQAARAAELMEGGAA